MITTTEIIIMHIVICDYSNLNYIFQVGQLETTNVIGSTDYLFTTLSNLTQAHTRVRLHVALTTLLRCGCQVS